VLYLRCMHENEAQLLNTLETVTKQMAVTRCSRDLCYLWANQAYADWIRRPLNEVVGRPILEVLGKDAFEALLPHFNRVLTGETVRYEQETDFQGIGPRWISAIYTPTHAANAIVNGWVARYRPFRDGVRATAYIESGVCRLVSRNLKTLQFNSLRASLAAIAVPNAVLDGEIIVLDRGGVSQFNALLTDKDRNVAVFYAFDLLWLNGNDFRRTPLVERKTRLSEFVRASRCPRLLYAQHIDGAGKEFFREICPRDLEGVVAKRKMGLYREDRPDWVKIKNRKYSQAEGRHEMLTKR
jgi:hypothetical protein